MKYLKLYENFSQIRSDESKIELTNILNSLSNQEIRSDIDRRLIYDQGITTTTFIFNKISVRRDQARYMFMHHNLKKDFGESLFSEYSIFENDYKLDNQNQNSELIYKIFTKVESLYESYYKLRSDIVEEVVDKYGMDEDKLKEIDSRIEEFDVIKDYKIDSISLNSLYDFLELPFNINESNEVNIKNANKPEEERISEEERRFNLEVKLTNLYNELSNQQIRNDIFHSQDYSDGKQTIRYQIPTIELVAEYMSAYRRYFVSLNHEYCDKFRQNIYVQLQRLFHYNNEFTNKIIRDLSVKISIDLGGYQTHQELLSIIKERIEEFEVIKNYQVDYISLNSLYDYYGCRFDENEFIFTLNSILKSTS